MWTPIDAHRGRAAYAHASAQDDDDPFDLPSLNGFPQSHAPSPTTDALTPFPAFPLETADADAHEEEADPFNGDGSVHSDEFVDAEAFMADHKPGEDSFLREATESGDIDMVWSDDEVMADGDAKDRRASAIFVPKSRNMDKVEFSSPKQKTMRKSISAQHETPQRRRVSNSTRTPAFSASNTVISSDYDIHVDHRLALTPNSFKFLQQRERQPTENLTLSNNQGSLHDSDHVSQSAQAKQVVDANADAISKNSGVPNSPTRPYSAERAMHAGPGVIKKALHEIESMLGPLNFDSADSDAEFDPALAKLKSRVREIPLPIVLTDDTEEQKLGVADSDVDGRDSNRRTKLPEVERKEVQVDRVPVSDVSGQARGNPQRPYNHSSKREAKLEDSHAGDKFMAVEEMGTVSISKVIHLETTPCVEDTLKNEAPELNKLTQAKRQLHSVATGTHVQATETGNENEASHFHARRPARPKEVHHGTTFRRASLRQSLEDAPHTVDTQDREDHDNNSMEVFRRLKEKETRAEAVEVAKKVEPARASIKASLNALPLAASVPSQMARRCRRLLCTVGERMKEQVVFSNGSSKVGRICVSLLPLSIGCQQFSVTPAVLELQPRSRSAFTITFDASRPGVVAGIFQFRAVGVDGLHEPYEVLFEASVRGDLKLSPGLPRPKTLRPSTKVVKSASHEPRVTELPAPALAGVRITPTFLRFTRNTTVDGRDGVMSSASVIRITNTTTESVDFQVKSSHEHLQLSKARGSLLAGSEVKIEVHPICCPFGPGADVGRDWYGSMTVIVGDVLSREVSVVIDRDALSMLPAFDDVARVRHAISAQTDSFYYTKKVNRRGLYFHARAVECGSCVVGESHHVPVYICNGSDAPMTVFLQALQEPFSCVYQPTTLQARKFIEVPVTFTPKATGKVATCLVAYTVSGKAAVTLIARGIDKSVLTVPAHS